MNKVDWFRVITDLNRAGVSPDQIGSRVGRTARTINFWKNGVSEPRYSDGAQLLEVHKTVVGST